MKKLFLCIFSIKMTHTPFQKIPKNSRISKNSNLTVVSQMASFKYKTKNFL